MSEEDIEESDYQEIHQNDHLVLVCGKSSAGKSASLMGLRNPEGVLYLNCEANKRLPFKSKFWKNPEGGTGFSIQDPFQIYEAFDAVEYTTDNEGNLFEPVLEGIHTIVIDTLTYLMDMYESQHIYRSKNGMQGWSDFQQYFKKLMQHYVAKSTKRVIFLAHVEDVLNKDMGIMETKVPIKGALKGNGIESYFSCIIMTEKLGLNELKPYDSPLLEITEDNQIDKFKHVFQTKLTADTVGTKIRAPIGMWERNETYIDNNIQLVLDRLEEYYND